MSLRRAYLKEAQSLAHMVKEAHHQQRLAGARDQTVQWFSAIAEAHAKRREKSRETQKNWFDSEAVGPSGKKDLVAGRQPPWIQTI